jgi:hypothetical protein
VRIRVSESRRFVLFELNEVPLRVVQHFAAKHPGSAFATMLARGRRWETVTPDQGHLSPWITWPTVHRGVDSSQHHIGALGQDVSDANRHFPPVWTLLTAAGRRVGLFGSLHSYPVPANHDNYDFYVPDTFAAGPEAKPAELSAFQAFNLQMVDRSGRNVSTEVPLKQGLSFLLGALPAGVRSATLAKIAVQLASERIWRDRAARRRTIQSLLAFDLFLAQLRAKKPDGAFFFTNHVASAMHRYWPATFREDYREARWSESWVRRFSGELDYAMGEADQMLGELMSFADQNPDYLILVTGSMGQSAVDSAERQIRTEVLLRDMGRFLLALGVTGAWERRRTMEPTYTLAFADAADADRFLEAIATVKVSGEPVQHRRLGTLEIEFVLGHPNVSDEDFTVTIGNRALSPADVGLANVMIDDEVGAAAYHIPQGMLLAYGAREDWDGPSSPEPVSSTRIAPTLLALQGVDAPSYMEEPIADLASRELVAS